MAILYYTLTNSVAGIIIFVILGFLIVILLLTTTSLSALTSILIINSKDRNQRVHLWRIAKSQIKNILPFIGISVLSGLIIFSGIMMFIIPSIVFSLWFTFATYVLIFENKKGIYALIKSRDLVRGKFFNILFYFFVFNIIYFVAQFSISYLLVKIKIGFLSPVVNFIMIPLSTIFVYVLYKFINSNQDQEHEITTRRLLKYRLLVILPILLVIILLLLVFKNIRNVQIPVNAHTFEPQSLNIYKQISPQR